MSEPKTEWMQYDPQATRAFYRLIARHDNGNLIEMRAAIRMTGGEIGNADFTDLDIRDGEKLLCARHRLRTNKAHWTATASELDLNHSWDADGVWFPVKGDAADGTH